MRSWLWLCVVLGAVFTAIGCGGGNSSVTISLSQTSATVRLNASIQFIPSVTGSTNTVQWSVNSNPVATATTPSGDSTVGHVDASGVYTAPATLPPSNTTITVNATVEGTGATASAAITLSSGVQVTITPGAYTIGTNEQFQFSATVTGVANDASIAGTCVAVGAANPSNLPLCTTGVTWSITGSNPGGIGPSSGIYNAPGSPTTASVTATSLFDTSAAATASVTILTASDPTITSISPRTGAAGTPFQDIYISGTDFFATTRVYVDNVFVGASQSEVVSLNSLTTMRVRLLDNSLTPGVHTITVSQQNGTPQSCATQAMCKLSLTAVRPAIVGASPNSVPQSQGGGGSFSFDVDGGYFGTATNPAVTVKVGGKSESATVHDGVTQANKDRQLSVSIKAADVSTPGLYPVEVDSNTSGVPPAIVNLAVQPSYPASAVSTVQGSPFTVGIAPAAVAVNTATGIAVVTNQGSNDITLIDVSQMTPVVLGFICTGTQNATLTQTESTTCPSSGPTGVGVDSVRNLALIANSGSGTIAVVDLNAQTVTAVLNGPTFNAGTASAVNLVPAAIGVNPVTGRALVAYRSTSVASILDLTQIPAQPQSQSTPSSSFFFGVVNVANSLNVRVAVSPKLNWALVTPGGLGSLCIVDLGRQSNVTIAAAPAGATRAAGTVTITTTSTHALQVGQPVLIQNMSDPSFNGYYTVVSVPSSTTFTYTQATNLPNAQSGASIALGATPATISYASPVATITSSLSVTGVTINDETQKALLTDPTGFPVTVLNLLDQSSTEIGTLPTAEQNGMIAAAFNPLANFGIAVNQVTGDATLIDPATPTLLTAPFSVGLRPVDVAIDPVTDRAIVVDPGSNPSQNGTVGIWGLGALRSAPQILQASVQPGSSLPGPPVIDGAALTVGSTLTSGINQIGSPTVSAQTLTVVGGGFTSSSKMRLDGTPLTTLSVSANGREMTAQVPVNMLLVPHRFALDVTDSNSGAVSNASSLTVIQRVDLTQATGCSTPAPQGVAIDVANNLAVVTEPGTGCNSLAIVDLTTGTAKNQGQPAVSLGTNTNPGGVAVLPSASLAVVANAGNNTASVVDEINAVVEATVTTDAGPTGVAIDPGTGNTALAATNANLLDVFPANSNPGTPTSDAVGQSPFDVAVDPSTHLAAVSNSSAGTVSLVDLSGSQGTLTASGFQLPEGVALDPCNATSPQTGDCVSGAFLVVSSGSNQVQIVSPSTLSITPVRVGINPTSIAYNFPSSTMVTANLLSQTMTVVDFIDHTVRAVFSVTPSSQFAVDIHPQTNLAVIADTTHNQLLLVPLPR